ncbi:YjbF family lipoprotein [Gammaproteobacteria bacterium]|nr:YjbF family lipoprotein [Gammaproteobacteria bacterium]
MIKIKYCIFFLALQISSCSVVSFSDSIPLLKAAFTGFENTPVTLNEFNTNEYSFAVVKFNRGREARFILSDINSVGIERWVGPEGTKIFALNGRILKTEGLDHDYQIINWQADNLDLININFIHLTKPQALFEQHTEYISHEKDVIEFHYEGRIETSLVKEQVTIQELNKKELNFYWTGNEGKIKRTIQHINPKFSYIEIDFFYKY